MRNRRRRQRVPYGYKLTDTGKEVECPDAQAVISRVVLDHWTGYSFGMIASCLTDEGVKALGGGDKWHGSGVERVWDRVTNGQMKRIEKERAADRKAQQEAAPASEAGQVAAELQRRQEPEVQLERTTGYVEIDTSTVDLRTGKTIKESAAFLNRQEWDKFQARQQAEDDAYKTMTARQRADAHRWRDPGRVEAGKSLAGVDQVVERQANKAGEDANYWLDRIGREGVHQPMAKAKLRVAIKLLIAELGIARQATLHYQKRAEKAEK